MSVLKSYSNAECIFSVPKYSPNTDILAPVEITKVIISALVFFKKSGSSSNPRSVSLESSGTSGDFQEIFKITGKFTEKASDVVYNVNECELILYKFPKPKRGILRYSLQAPSPFYDEAKILGISFYGDLMIL